MGRKNRWSLVIIWLVQREVLPFFHQLRDILFEGESSSMPLESRTTLTRKENRRFKRKIKKREEERMGLKKNKKTTPA
ncbi:hypothetical protein OnM2_00661 [Erysiphe neolycopersici]|uniref:Uncharacterized protein n=1 Tax=Erysiphe neolycopersici TaxID=212602 RepID=A0A420HI25_9PEZI|nr:hypothetical protein OnM2_00661 [Erysiphe neolycopersici]